MQVQCRGCLMSSQSTLVWCYASSIVAEDESLAVLQHNLAIENNTKHGSSKDIVRLYVNAMGKSNLQRDQLPKQGIATAKSRRHAGKKTLRPAYCIVVVVGGGAVILSSG